MQELCISNDKNGTDNLRQLFLAVQTTFCYNPAKFTDYFDLNFVLHVKLSFVVCPVFDAIEVLTVNHQIHNNDYISYGTFKLVLPTFSYPDNIFESLVEESYSQISSMLICTMDL
jgi:hypothetical protein